ncbi:hypothetical protein NW759_010647 [Fusarium solani]|nr:hypothetical protein NW759_010647 [Fusarium solani]
MLFAASLLLLGASVRASTHSSFDHLNLTIFQDIAFTTSEGGAASCVSGKIPIPVSFEAYQWTLEKPSDSLAVTDFVFWATTTHPDRLLDLSVGIGLVDKTYQIWVKYCVPTATTAQSSNQPVQVLTHGGTLDHTYWDVAPGYSYVNITAAAGMRTLSYDRLGCGLSDHPDPLNEVQGPAAMEVLHGLVSLLRSGAFGQKFDKVIGVGHSIGSKTMEATLAKYRGDFDAILHTGYAFENAPGAGNVVATGLGPAKDVQHLRHLPDGYFVHKSREGIHICFFKYPNFEPASKLPSKSWLFGFQRASSRSILSDSSHSNIGQISNPHHGRDVDSIRQPILGKLDGAQGLHVASHDCSG